MVRYNHGVRIRYTIIEIQIIIQLKVVLSDYQLLDMIYTHFLGSTLDNAEQEILKDIDNAMLWYDLTYLLHEKQPLPKPQVYDEPDYTVRPFTDVEEEYLQIYRTFIQKLH